MAGVNETVPGLAAYYEYVAAHLTNGWTAFQRAISGRKPYPYGNSAGHLVLH